MRAHVGDDLVGEIVARVVHGQHDAVDGEPGIERLLHLLDGLQQLRQTFEREELALQRHQDRVRRRHRVDGEQIERRRTIDQHIGEVGRAGARRRSAAPARCAAGRRGRAPGRSRVRGRRDRASTARSTAAAPRSAASRRAATLRRSARHRSSARASCGRCRDRSRRCPADRDRRSARARRWRRARCRD